MLKNSKKTVEKDVPEKVYGSGRACWNKSKTDELFLIHFFKAA